MPIALELNSGRVPVKVWTPDLEPESRRQLENVSCLPIVHGHIAAMPDVHAGIGATVGSVIPTLRAVVPAAVGVDIGCFTGDTEVILADSRAHRLDDLARRGGEFCVYSCTSKGRIRGAKATALLTRRSASLVEVELDNGRKIRCTPDHRFMLRDGTYAEAQSLWSGCSLMPFYSNLDHEGYLRVLQPNSGKFQRAHWIMARSGLLGPIPSFEGHAFYALRGRARPEHFRASVAGNGQRGRQYLEKYNRSEKGRAKSREIANRVHTCPKCGRMIRGYGGFFTHRRAKQGLLNHKVVAVRPLPEQEDVYCLTVPEYQNFALAAGVFVHNCGMNAVQLSLQAKDLPASLGRIRGAIESAVPVGFGMHAAAKGRGGRRERASKVMEKGLRRIVERNPHIASMQKNFEETWVRQLGTLGGGNHFIEVCLDESQNVWVMLHSGSRGIGNVIGRYFIERARREMEREDIHLPHRDLAWFAEGAPAFDEYVDAVHWAQDYAMENRREMMRAILAAIEPHLPSFDIVGEAIQCHHNYVARETHFGENLFITRKGAIRAGEGEMGIIPGSMGAKSFIVRGKGNPQSFCSCAHGAGRLMSRTEAKRRFSQADVERQTAGVECRKDAGVIDEIPGAYKDIDEVMRNQSDLVDIVHTLKQIVCVKG